MLSRIGFVHMHHKLFFGQKGSSFAQKWMEMRRARYKSSTCIVVCEQLRFCLFLVVSVVFLDNFLLEPLLLKLMVTKSRSTSWV